MGKYKIVSEDGKWFVSVMFGGAYVGGTEDSGYVFKTKKEAKEVIRKCQYQYDSKLIAKKVA